MSVQYSHNHFPCGPCPVADTTFERITYYRMMLDNLRLFQSDPQSPIEREHLVQKIHLVEQILETLWEIYHVAQEALSEYVVLEST